MTTSVDPKQPAAEPDQSSKITAAELSEKDAPQNPSVARAYFQLLKPRVMTLVVFTAAVGLWLAPGEIEAWRAALGLLILAIGAGASGALNMWYDRDIDAIMSRTKKRPIPNGDVSANNALIYGLVLSIGSVIALGFVTNWVAAGILAFTNAF
ncbi:MAG: UbiA family prenyltransferase, partial [Alphaproteobacteria bacterium]